MSRKTYSLELRRRVLQDVARGEAVAVVIQRYGIAEATYYRWRDRHGDALAGPDRRIAGLEEENRRLRDLVAEAALDLQALRAELKLLKRRLDK